MLLRIKKWIRDREINRLQFGSKGTNVRISVNNEFHNTQKIVLGDNIYIGTNCVFHAIGGIEIGSGSILANYIEIITFNHNYDGIDLQSLPYDKKYIKEQVIIEENVWVGSHSLILPGITIGEGAVIGMGSVVTKDVPPFAVVGGNPAKIIKYRNDSKYWELKDSDKIYLKLKK